MINSSIIRAMKPCTPRFENYLNWYSDFEGTAREFGELPEITLDDKIWVLRRIANNAQVVKWGALCAQSVLHFFEEKYPNDKRPRIAVEAALGGVMTDEIRANAADAAYAAYAADAANAAAYAANAAAYAANADAAVGTVADAAAAADADAAAARAAAYAARAVADAAAAAYATRAVADAAAAARAAAAAYDATAKVRPRQVRASKRGTDERAAQNSWLRVEFARALKAGEP